MDEVVVNSDAERGPEWSYAPSTQSFHKATLSKENYLSKFKNMWKEDELPSQFEKMWNKVFVLACVLAVSLDPLFFYIPMIDKKQKCIVMDKKLKTFAIVFRLLSDLTYTMDIIYYIAKASKALKREKPSLVWKKGEFRKYTLEVARRLSWLHVLVDFLAILPVPQVAILNLLPKWKTTSTSSLHTKTFLNAVILSQYVPRIFRIYLSCVEFTRSAGIVAGTLWVKGALNFFLYILASHILGSFWYFFSIQRETSCWKQACQGKTGQCAPRIGDCGSSNATLLDLSCPKDPPNTTLFDFGIFVDALKSDVVESNSNDFSKKVFYCFWWGLQNLSSLGENLQTSTYKWENCFAVSISIIGLLLFLYLIGNIQVYMQWGTTRSEEIRQKMKLKIIDIDTWIKKNDLPKSWKPVMVQKVQHILEKENRDVDVESLFLLLPAADRMSIKRHLCIKILRKVHVFQNMKQSVLEDICSHLKPVIYGESSYIVRDGDPLDRMVFVTQGTLLAFTSSRSNSNVGSSSSASSRGKSIFSTSSRSMRRLNKGDYHGEELLEWSLTHLSFAEFPISTANVMCHTKVEGFVLKSNDLLNAVKRYWWHFKRLSPYSSSNVSHLQVEHWQSSAASVIQTLWRHKLRKRPVNYFRHVHGGNLQGSSNKYYRLLPIAHHQR